jgi:hypothetical protein
MEIQNEIKDIILGKESSLNFVKSTETISAKERLLVHKNTVFTNFISRLRIIYPGVWRLIGKECARSVAFNYSFDYRNLTSRAEINEFGKNFPEFLQRSAATKHLKYLPDFAHLEYLKYRSYFAIKQDAIPFQKIQSYFASDVENCTVKFNDSVFFYQSDFPLMDIQDLLDNPDCGELKLQKNPCFIIICRVKGRIETLYLEQKKWRFLKQLNDGDSIKTSMNIFTDEALQTEMPDMVKLMLNKQMLVV